MLGEVATWRSVTPTLSGMLLLVEPPVHPSISGAEFRDPAWSIQDMSDPIGSLFCCLCIRSREGLLHPGDARVRRCLMLSKSAPPFFNPFDQLPGGHAQRAAYPQQDIQGRGVFAPFKVRDVFTGDPGLYGHLFLRQTRCLPRFS